jgi:predicted NBD/HSP70 family sugar kinase
LAGPVGDSEKVRRNNRGLVLAALRVAGPLPRTQLAGETGLSHATITAITQDMLAQGLLIDLPDGERGDGKGRGRPAVRLAFNRAAAALVLVEIDVNRARFSLVDYGGTLIDRIEWPDPDAALAAQTAAAFVSVGIAELQVRNRVEMRNLRRIAVSLQGILDRDGSSLKWSPVPRLAGQDLAHNLMRVHDVPVALHKRGRLLAEGTRWLDPDLREKSVATIFVGSTVAMGMTFSGHPLGRADGGATEFGHMNHVPGGALCRCGMKGCVEAYAADYGILRAAFSVPEHVAPAAHVPVAQFDELIARAQGGDRRVAHAFNLAGRAIGYGLNRLLAVFDPTDVVIVGPGARAFELMRAEIEAALAASLVAQVNGMPAMHAFRDESEPIFTGLMMKTLDELDQADFAMLPAVPARA